MTKPSDKIAYRLATPDDETDILAILEEVAPEIPVLLEKPEIRENLITEIGQCTRLEHKSWIAIDAEGKIVGVALARNDLREKDRAISLKYIGVNKNERGNRISSVLIEKVKANGVPLTASVLNDNRSQMADRLMKKGFKEIDSDGNETKFRWNP